jgi:UDP-glucose 4-epimerase
MYGAVRAVVTGGAGFIGSNLVDALLARGDEVTVVDNFASGKRENLNPGAALLEHDIREPFSVEADVVFHLAAQADVQTSMKRPEYDAAVNVVGTVNVLQAAPAAQVVFASSGGAGYGECPEPATEEAPFLPLSAYGIAKKCGEEYLAGWNRIHGSSHVSLRFGNVFGERQDSGLEGGVVAIFLERMARGEETVIYGDGGQSRDFVYVGDVVDALLAAAGRGGGPYNVGTGVATSVNELHAACRRVAGVDEEPRHEAARLGDVIRSVLDPSRAERELGWRARVTLDDGLARTWAWTKEARAT